MEKIIVLVFTISLIMCTPVAALPQYSSETLKQMEAAGIEHDTPLDEVSDPHFKWGFIDKPLRGDSTGSANGGVSQYHLVPVAPDGGF